MKQIKLAPFLCFLLCLTACDKGRSSLRKVEESYPLINGKLTLDNIEDADIASSGLLIVAEAYKDEASGKEALKKYLELKAKAQALLAEQQTKIGEAATNIVNSMKESEKLSNSLKERIQKHKSEFGKFSFKKGDCIAEYSGREFDKESSLFSVSIRRIEKVGESEVLAKVLYSATKGDQNVHWQKDLEAAEPAAESKFTMERGLKIPCSEADKMVASFQKAAEVQAGYADFSKKIRYLVRLAGAEQK